MCMILGFTNIGGGTVLDCSEYSGEFLGTSVLKILDEDKNIFLTRNFVVEKTRSCFGDGGNPWVMVKEDIPANFLKKGNTVIFDN